MSPFLQEVPDVNFQQDNVMCYGLSLPLSHHEAVRDCVSIYCDWLQALTRPKPHVPRPVCQDPNTFARKIIAHFYNLFVPRPDTIQCCNPLYVLQLKYETGHLWLDVPSRRPLNQQNKLFKSPNVSKFFNPLDTPLFFSGEPAQNAEKWLKEFHRVARYNHWDNTMCLANVYFFLSGTARSWFENIEEQEKSELCDIYIQEILNLCKQIDPKMSESEKVAHLLKGISEDIYRSIVILDIDTTEDFLRLCRKIEKSNKQRVNKRITTQRCFDRSSRDRINRGLNQMDSLRRSRRALNAAPTAPEPSPLKTIIIEEFGKNLAAISNPVQRAQPQYKTQTRIFARTPRQRYPDQDTSVFNQTPSQRRTDQWRTQDNKPICFHCGRPGHVKRYCRDRQPVDQYELERPKRYTQTRQTTQFNEEHSSRSQNYRQPSPYPNRERSPRRQSISPGRHTSQSPRCYNLEKN
ncbi:RALGAPB [Cordylochernes scorpioides]|uniref:RALGAPB n=1 Tax=Cordylochernes scorpioides TaxID=51811 RepID=A0ABY6K9Y3_9ARAC|nr:RALGAPB [Cordylochernes scorpioides]